MKRVIISLALTAGMFVASVGTAPAAQASRVRCYIPTNYKVTCYNNTPYIVYVKLRMYTTAGLRVKYFAIKRNKYSVYSPAYINRITWRWHF